MLMKGPRVQSLGKFNDFATTLKKGISKSCIESDISIRFDPMNYVLMDLVFTLYVGEPIT